MDDALVRLVCQRALERCVYCRMPFDFSLLYLA